MTSGIEENVIDFYLVRLLMVDLVATRLTKIHLRITIADGLACLDRSIDRRTASEGDTARLLGLRRGYGGQSSKLRNLNGTWTMITGV